MAGVNVVVCPGISGSNLVDDENKVIMFGSARQSAFGVGAGVAAQLILGNIRNLALLEDGSPTVRTTLAGLIGYYYQLIIDAIRLQGWNVIEAPYDWRMGPRAAAQSVWQTILDKIGNTDPFYFIGHSYGTYVARAMYRLFPQSGRWKHVFFVGAPGMGSPDALQALFGIGETYITMTGLVGLGYGLSAIGNPRQGLRNSGWLVRNGWNVAVGNPITSPLDTTLQTFDGLFNLQPLDPEFIDPSWWAGHGIPVTSTMLARVSADKSYVNPLASGALPDSLTTWIAGDAVNTPANLFDKTRPSKKASYSYTTAGDGRTTIRQASVLGANGKVFTQAHANLLRDPDVIGYILSLIGAQESVVPVIPQVVTLPAGTPPVPVVVGLNQSPPLLSIPTTTNLQPMPVCLARSGIYPKNVMGSVPNNVPSSGGIPLMVSSSPNVMTRR